MRRHGRSALSAVKPARPLHYVAPQSAGGLPRLRWLSSRRRSRRRANTSAPCSWSCAGGANGYGARQANITGIRSSAIPRPDSATKPPRLSSGCPPPLASRRKLGTNGYAAIGASRTAAITCATSLSPRTPPASERTPTSPPACDPSPTTSSEQAEATMSETPDGAPLSISA